ncbi:hypothetical protein [Bacillus stercoris]|uniref:hypothetical protein n=1 Tax=Bacillus stercoris TaxID=2054641 RepID=UPI002572E02B|nr:hypothetical protein [Bacillus stercoris]MDL9994663.1 hypothetical protein [Bacillus stercoris]
MELLWITDIPKEMRPAVLTATTTLVGAFIGACVAQFFSHRLVLRREKKNNQRLYYNELYAPILLKMYKYCDFITEFNKSILKDDPIDEQLLLNEINDHIGEKLKYASPKIINAYNELKRFDYVDDLSGISLDCAQFNLYEEILNELIKIAPYDRKSKKEISKYRTMYFLLKFITRLYGLENAKLFLEYRFYFKKNKLYSKLTYRYLSFLDNIRSVPFLYSIFVKKDYSIYLDALVVKSERPFTASLFAEQEENKKDNQQNAQH